METDARETPDAPDTARADRLLYAFRRNVFVAASAGTGKTYRLTALYLLLTLGMTSMGQRNDRTATSALTPDRIVATTFSRAAAREIASRVEAALRALASAPEGPSPADLARLPFYPVLLDRADRLGEPLDLDALRVRANDALGRFGGARIDTLHGVARRIVQRGALSLGLAPDQRVLDEEEAQALGDLAVDDALSAALASGGRRREAARALIHAAGGVGFARFRVQRLLDRLDEEGIAPEDLVLADHLVEARATATRVHALARSIASEGAPAAREPALALDRALSSDPSALLPEAAIGPLIELLTRRLPARSKRTPSDDELEDLLESLQGKTKSERAWSLVAWLSHGPRLGERERDLVELLRAARAGFGAAKRRAGGVGFGDLLRMARDAMRDDPELAADVRDEVGALLVDEFQDTSRVQRDLVYLLREREDASRARAPGERPRATGLAPSGLFLVGDRKQSIYGFRGADVAVFARVAAELAGEPARRALALGAASDLASSADDDAEPIADFIALRESRRSTPEVLAFVNAFSTRDFVASDPAASGGAPRSFEIVYGPGEHLVPAPSSATSPARGRVVLVRDDGESPEDAPPLVREASGAAREAHVAAAAVASITHGAALADRIRYRDVVVLARRRSTIPLVEVALSRLDIPYVVAGRALYDTPEVRDIAALLRLVLDPRDRFALAVVLRGPMVALSDGSLARLAIQHEGLFLQLLVPGAAPREGASSERRRLEAFRARFAEVRRAALRLPPADAIRALIAAFDLDRVLAALPRADARVGNLDRLTSIARRRGGTLAGFVQWLERRVRDETDEAEAAVFSEEDDAVRLTTIHASKGLDFEAVILVDVNAEPRADPGGVGVVAEDERALFAFRHYLPRPRAPGHPHDRALVALGTTALRAHLADARAREQAERRRLSYVAITRAKRILMIVGAVAPPRPNAALATLFALASDEARDPALLEEDSATRLLAEARPAAPAAPVAPASATPAPAELSVTPPASASRARARALDVDATTLATFAGCPRRAWLRHDLGVPELAPAKQLDLFSPPQPARLVSGARPPAFADPRSELRSPRRAAHRVLERARGPLSFDDAMLALAREGLVPAETETRRLAVGIAALTAGRWFASSWLDDARSIGEETLSATFELEGGDSITVRATCDRQIEREGAGVDLVMVVAEPVDAGQVEIGLAVLGLARAAIEGRVRVGRLDLGVATEPAFTVFDASDASDASTRADAEAKVAKLARAWAEARRSGGHEGRPRPVCAALGCGFIRACHDGEPR